MSRPRSLLTVSLLALSVPASWLGACSGETQVPAPTPKHAQRAMVEIGRRAGPANDTFALTDAPVPGLPDLRAPGNPVLRLDLLPGRVSLPDVSTPASLAEVGEEFVVPHKEMPNPRGAPRKLKVLVAPLPFAVETDEQTFRPEGMSVTIDGKVVPFGRGPAPKAEGSTWRIAPNGKQLVISHPTIPADGAVSVKWPRIREVLDRHDPRAYLGEDRPASDFLQASVTVGGDTRNGLLLVAPTTLEWPLTLPAAQPVFSGFIGMEAPPIDDPASAGMDVSLSVVTADGAVHELDRRHLTGPGEAEEWRVDLTPYAGQAVTVRLAAEPGEDSVFDWGYVAGPVITAASTSDVRRVIVVAMDTTRPDHFSFNGYERPTTPELDVVLGQSLVFDHTWSTAPRTRPSFRSSTTGRLPLEAVGATNIGDVFRQHGFVTAGIVANVHLQPRFDFDDGFDWWSFDGKADAADQVDRGLEWLRANVDHDSYLFLHFMDPHMAYDAPAAYRDRFVKQPTLAPKVKRADVLQWMAKGTLTDAQKEELEALHDGEMAFMSHELGRFFAEVDRLPGRTLVVLHSDHGEEFWEHDGFEHNHSLYDELVRTMLAFRTKGGVPDARRISSPASLMDVAPTLYDLLGFADAPVVDGRSLVPVLAGQPVEDRALAVGYLQYAHERWAVVWQNRKYILHTGSGREELYDIVADPGETRDLSKTTDLQPFRERLATAHGLDVGPGYRLIVKAEPGSGQVRFALPAPARAANVLDPESVVEHRANIEWGEVPRKSPVDVGKVVLEDDGRTVVWNPGRKPQGILWVRFDGPQPATGVTASVDGKPQPVVVLPEAGAECERWCVAAGTVVVPPESEAARIARSKGGGDDLAQLCALGYVTEGCDAADVAPEPVSDDEHGHDDPEDAPSADG